MWTRYEWEPPEHVGKPVWLHPAERWSDPAYRPGPEHDALREAITRRLRDYPSAGQVSG